MDDLHRKTTDGGFEADGAYALSNISMVIVLMLSVLCWMLPVRGGLILNDGTALLECSISVVGQKVPKGIQ